MPADLYQELGVSRSASDDEIKRAYRKLAAKYHPDKNQGDDQAEAKFKAINYAHDVLSDDKKRKLYDEFGEMGLREGFNPSAARGFGGRGNSGNVGLDDIFNNGFSGFGDLFGDVFGGRAAARGADAAAEVSVDFVSAIRGANVRVHVPNVPDGITIRVPPGANDGDKVRAAGYGSPGPNGASRGDLLLTIRVKPHDHFERDGLDLKLNLPISVGEAVRGGKAKVPTPEGVVSLKIPAGATSGQVVRLRGRGVRRQNRLGDLYVTFMIQLPQSDSKRVLKAVDALTEETDLSERDAISF